jgi:DNA ligase-1
MLCWCMQQRDREEEQSCILITLLQVWDDERKLIPFAKAYSGLTDKEIAEVDRFVKQHTDRKIRSGAHGETRNGV